LIQQNKRFTTTSSPTAFQEAQLIGAIINTAIVGIENLNPEAILDSGESEIHDEDIVQLPEKRTEDLAYFRFRSEIDIQCLDKRISTVGKFSLGFALRLSYHIYDLTTKNIQELTPFSLLNLLFLIKQAYLL